MNEHLRVCCLSFRFWPCIGGAEVRTEKHARQLQTLGHKVLVVTLGHDRQWPRAEIIDGLPVVRVGGIYKRGGQLRIGKAGHLVIMVKLFFALWRMRASYDILHIFQLTPISCIVALVGTLAAKPTIISISSAGPTEEQLARIRQGAMLMSDTLAEDGFLRVKEAQRWAVEEGDITSLPGYTYAGHTLLTFLRMSSAIYHILSTRSSSYLTAHGFRVSQIVHIPGAVDVEKFQPAAERHERATQVERNIICVARLEFAKGVDVLLHAWGRMMRESSAWRETLKPRLLLVGDGLFREQMERIMTELDSEDSVEFLGQRTDIVPMLQHAWGFVLPSRWEGMPNTLLEAMSCGLPCLATRVSGSEDIIADGVNGLLVEPEDAVAMASALHRLIADSELAQRLGSEGRATVLRDYQLSTIVERHIDLYKSLMEQRLRF